MNKAVSAACTEGFSIYYLLLLLMHYRLMLSHSDITRQQSEEIRGRNGEYTAQVGRPACTRKRSEVHARSEDELAGYTLINNEWSTTESCSHWVQDQRCSGQRQQ